MKNGIIINGKTYALKRKMYYPCMPDICHQCDIEKICSRMNDVTCRIFEKPGYVEYFKEVKQ